MGAQWVLHRKYLAIPGQFSLFLLLCSYSWQGTYKGWTKRDSVSIPGTLLFPASQALPPNTGSGLTSGHISCPHQLFHTSGSYLLHPKQVWPVQSAQSSESRICWGLLCLVQRQQKLLPSFYCLRILPVSCKGYTQKERTYRQSDPKHPCLVSLLLPRTATDLEPVQNCLCAVSVSP